jgi:hypothetical protein
MYKFSLLLLLFPLLLSAQRKTQINDIQVLRNGNVMQNPWVGGLNNPVSSPIDINQDGLMDLFIYDKAGWKALAFINTGSTGRVSFTYAPQYDLSFPSVLRDWAFMRDYNRDGVYDIFALTSNSDMAVYKGYRNGSNLSYVLANPKLSYPIGAFYDHMWTFSDNMPIVTDIDKDGDLDVVCPDIAGGTVLDYYQNQSVERGYNNDSLVFILQDQCWGRFQQHSLDCGISLAQCKMGMVEIGPASQASRHMGGATFSFDYDNDRDEDILLSDIACTNIKFLQNDGDTSYANVQHYDSIFPNYDVPVNLPLFPAAYGIDADNDGFNDLFISPFASNSNTAEQSEDVRVIQYYRNQGLTQFNKFNYKGDTTLTGGIVDVGTESHPVFFDYNGDGLQDIVVGNYGRYTSSGAAKSGLALYENIGSDTMPRFTEVSLNWSGLNAYFKAGMYPSFGDMDGDGKPDMIVGDATGKIHFFKNTSTNNVANYPSMTQQNWFSIDVGENAAPFIYDVNGDGLKDMVIGSRVNNILYYWNFGTPTNPQFSKDSVNPFFGRVRVYDYLLGNVPGYATPFITSENGSLVLYSGSQRGITFKFAINRDSLRSGTFDLLDSDVLGVKPGLRSNVNIADINHDGYNDYLVGNIRGGMSIYSYPVWGNNHPAAVAELNADQDALEVFPIPARDQLICRIKTESETIATTQLYDMLGAAVTTPISSRQNNELTIDVSQVAQGIYILQLLDTHNRAYQKKIAIIK